MLTQPTPTPSALAASQRFCTAQTVLYRSISGWAVRPRTTGPCRDRSQVMQRFRGDSQIPSSLSDRYASPRSPSNRPAASALDRSKAALIRRPDLGRPDHQEVPGLHEPDRRGVVGRHQQPAEHVVGDRVGQEVAAVPPLEDRPVDRGAFVGGEGVVGHGRSFDVPSLSPAIPPPGRYRSSARPRNRPLPIGPQMWLSLLAFRLSPSTKYSSGPSVIGGIA